ncbi:MAG: hypothetical protein ACREXW_01095 [Gammaproteobacteria bacterium]
MSQQSPEKVARRAKRKEKSAAWLARMQAWAEERFDAGNLTIPGVPWRQIAYVEAVYDAARSELEQWVIGKTDIPCLRHYGGRLMHAVGRLSMARVILAMIQVNDYRTDTIAVPYQDQHSGLWYFGGRSIKKIAEFAGVSYWACKRRIDWIVKQGLMNRIEQCGRDLKGEKYGRPSIRKITDGTLWKAIGKRTAHAFKSAARQAYSKWKDEQEEIRLVIDAAKVAAQKAAAAVGRAAHLTNTRSRGAHIGAAIQALLAGMRPDYKKRAPS